MRTLPLASLLLLLMLSSPAWSSAPYRVHSTVSLRSGNWFPLEPDEMKSAASDAALAELSSLGLLALAGEKDPADGDLAFEVSLVGAAETAKLTLTLNLAGQPTYASMASISVRGLDFQGIHEAFEHVGREAASRLVVKVEALREAPTRMSGDGQGDNDPALQTRYDRAQQLKHAKQWHESRVLFERVATASGAGSARLRGLAQDELRYGLPLFEAQQSVLGLGRLQFPRQRELYDEGIARAENLFRQIQAENPRHGDRVQEAQRALDELAVSRVALDNARRSTSLARVATLRMYLMEHVAAEGGCPPPERVHEMISQLPMDLRLVEHQSTDDGSWRYGVLDESTDFTVRLRCHGWQVEVEPFDAPPAAPLPTAPR